MSEESSERFAFPFLSAGQAQKEIFHNEALLRIDMLLHAAVESADVSVPPGDPVPGQCWIVAAGASGAWSGKAHSVAGWSAGGWRFCAPVEDMQVSVADRGHAMMYRAGAWGDAPVRADGYFVDGTRVVAAQQDAIANPAGGATVDGEARATIAAILGSLRAHGLIDSA